MKEIWNKTQKYYKETTEDDKMVNQWWLLWVLCFILDNQSDRIGSSFFGDDLQSQSIISICSNILWSQTIGAKVYSQEGNSPDYSIRTSIII